MTKMKKTIVNWKMLLLLMNERDEMTGPKKNKQNGRMCEFID